METHLLDLTLQSPLSASKDRSASNRQATSTVVPPQTLRGALAAATERAGADDDVMDRLFGTGGLRSSALLPAGMGDTLPLVAPLTLRTCKRNRGFREEHDAHGVEDTLFASLQLALEGETGGLEAQRTCQIGDCGHVMTRKGGLVRAGDDGYRTQPAPGKRTQAHVGLDRRRDGAASGMLYAQEVVNEKTTVGGAEGLCPTAYRAAVTGDEADLSRLSEALSAVGTVRVGTALSRGLGRCEVEGFRPRPSPPPVADRVEAFNDAFQGADGTREKPLVALTLRTPALFVDDFLRPEPAPGGAQLLQAARSAEAPHAEALAELDRVHEVARSYQFQAWNGLAGFPHATDQGLRAGSVLVYRAPALTEELLSALAHIEGAGVGLRRELGLGRVRVCDPIHTEVHQHSSTPSN